MCSTPRGSPVGLESGKVPNSAITFSSNYSHAFGKPEARLNSPSAWIANDDDEDPWLQIKFDSAFIITAIMTQGRKTGELQWVTSYTVSSSMNGASWTHYQDINTNTVKVLPLGLLSWPLCTVARLSHVPFNGRLASCNTVAFPNYLCPIVITSNNSITKPV